MKTYILLSLLLVFSLNFSKKSFSEEYNGYDIHQTKNFITLIKQDANLIEPVIHIMTNDFPRKSVFQSFTSKSFLTAVIRDVEFKHANSNYLIDKERVKKICEKPLITHTELKGSSKITIEGHFADDKCDLKFTLSFEDKGLGRMAFKAELDKSDWKSSAYKLEFSYSKLFDEEFYGFGAQASHLNLAGKEVRILSTEQGHGRGFQPYTNIANSFTPGVAGDDLSTYAPVPFYFTESDRGLFLNDYEYSEFDLRDKNFVSIFMTKSEISGEILSARSPAGMTELFTGIVGRMKALPDWSHSGAVLGIMGGSENISKRLQSYRQHNLEIAGLWIQDWVGRRKTTLATRLWWNWTVDRTSYPDWEHFVQKRNEEGIAVLAYINPFLTEIEDGYKPDRDLFSEAKQKGYLVVGKNGEPVPLASGGFDGYMIDLTNMEARSWIKTIIKSEFLEKGISGWMADFGEALPMDTKMHDGSESVSYHNRYPYEWAKVQREAREEFELENPGLLSRKPVAFHRSGFTKSPSNVDLFWLGDQLVSWDKDDGLKSSITGLLSAGLSGQTINHSDIGGYVSVNLPLIPKLIRTRELMKRWTELNAFTSFFRTHEGTNPALGVQFDTDEDLLKFFSYYSKVFKELFDYRKSLFAEAEKKGYPVVRPLFFHYPKDQKSKEYPYQFMLGKDMLVAPITEKGETKKKVYLPEGSWTSLWSGETVKAGARGALIDVDAPIGKIPVFYSSKNPLLKIAGANIRNLKPNY